ncbi:neuronal growth regulator 1 isoform X1 [Drosophila obscura]|uniref:neuronal growth regulator 1 isoform X1 n=2 Tax=Drosophila obscura TaxID=7282 RepID=UPI001BB20A6E|nr:neuronal growth regulator 1 isoform X1 [Drosophila obscura]
MMAILVVKKISELIVDSRSCKLNVERCPTQTFTSSNPSQLNQTKLAQLQIGKAGGFGGGIGARGGPRGHWLSLLVLMLCNCVDFTVSNQISSVGAFEPDFVIPLENVTIAQGRDATFTCVVNNLGGHRVSGDGATVPAKVAWIKADAKAILAIHEHVITNNDRLTVQHNDYNTWTLNIRSVKMEDSGKYMCQVNTDPMKMQTATLEVVIPPDIINEETSGDLMVPEGGAAKLVCRARGHPKPRITWRREDGREIIARHAGHQKTKAPSVEGEMLTLSKVTRSEMGAYMCIASNGVPPSVSKRMKLQVHFHPLVQVPNQLVGAPVLTDVTLICNVEASPKAINYWQRENGEMIIAGDRYALTEKEHNMYSMEMVLHIKRLQSSDFGGYKCISKNSIGDTEGTIRLYEMERPGRKQMRDDDINEVTRHEVENRHKENRHEEGSRNQNGRLYKDRTQEPELGSSADSTRVPAASQRTIQLIKTFILALLVLLATTATGTAEAVAPTTTTAAATMFFYTKGARQKDTKETNLRLELNGAGDAEHEFCERSATTTRAGAGAGPNGIGWSVEGLNRTPATK